MPKGAAPKTGGGNSPRQQTGGLQPAHGKTERITTGGMATKEPQTGGESSLRD